MSSDLRQRLGRRGERLAAEHFERLGYDVLERNYRSRWGELDLVVGDRRTIVFCEVKTRRLGSGAPFEGLGPTKRRQVRRMAAEWLIERPERPFAAELRFDAVGVTIDAHDRFVRLDHEEAAF